MSFIREFYIDLLDKTLSFHQKIEGDVSCVVWDASIVLAKYMEERCKKNINFLKNKRVLELGAGLGCVGLTAACLGACVVLTDLHNALPLLELNIKCNRDVLDELNTSIEAKTLQWGQDCDIKFTPDIILLADCIYYEGVIMVLLSKWGRCLQEG
ncbi:protein N-lysine methyltransferase METTL21D isoform X2 [Aethina tumida]|uniref:protein N-lysine methyltransferase METTL21D isoform X2 n=1 Tax=Aethina tumida TaxID=116153 RepID=UPI00096B28DD|nr:protein N-lysine methyltransferase METTL21D isoform X2 [Aethina tumida]